MSWADFTMAEICSDFKYGKMPPKDKLADTGYPVYSGYRVSGYAKEYLYEKPQLILVARGVGGTGDVKISPPRAWITNLSIVLSLDETKMNKRFLYYKLGNEPLKERLNTGAAQAQITVENLKPYRVSIPDLPTQERIASILSAYDDLIENNRRRIALLEQAARLLYREWFVHFRFPGHETAKFVDGLPEGWELRSLIAMAEITMGQSPKSEFYNDRGEGLPFHQGVTNYGFRFVEDKMFSTVTTKLANAGDILFSVRAPVGRINYTLNKIVLGRGLSAFKSATGHQSFLFYCLKNHFFKEDLIGGGAIYAATNKKELENLEVLYPTAKLVDEFDSKAQVIDAQIKALILQNAELTCARDLLLPRLMDGRIPV
jgi:type I restriction enzyme S subunit